MHTFTNNKLLMLKPEQIHAARYQPRRKFDEDSLKALADSISLIGIVQPIIVRKTKLGYEIISGERRLRAAVMAGLRRVPCVVHKTSEVNAAFYALSENLQHEKLNFFDEARSINSLIIRYRLTANETALRLGFSPELLSSKLRLLRLDEAIQKKIISTKLCEDYAYLLLRLDEDMREDVLSLILAENMNIKQAQKTVDDILNPKSQENPPLKESLREPLKQVHITDSRLVANSLDRLINIIEDTALTVEFKKNENQKYTEYKFKIKKDEEKSGCFEQLKIC